MDYTSDPSTNQHPDWHDYKQLDSIYGHLDPTTTVGSATLSSRRPPAMAQLAFDAPVQWGQLVRSSRNQRAQVYELAFGGGNRVVTHVIWADPQADARWRLPRT